jgi:hypothetical protein
MVIIELMNTDRNIFHSRLTYSPEFDIILLLEHKVPELYLLLVAEQFIHYQKIKVIVN